ncbi:MAG: hypothetical protein EXR47_00535 [Dehalococcoidia bacterium]|nr:hypothetical protein [Dehalococcoidia bacterium]
MINRQIAILFLIGVAMAVAGVVAAVATPLPEHAVGTFWAATPVLRALFAVAALMAAGSQVLIVRSVLRGAASGQASAGTNLPLEMVWSALPAAMVLAAVVYAVLA